MTTITKERIELFIKNPLDNGLTRGEQMELARIALASLEAEAVMFCISGQNVDSEEHVSTSKAVVDAWVEEWNQVDRTPGEPLYKTVPLYHHPALPASVVPEGLVKAVRFYEQVKRENPPVETVAWKDAVEWVIEEACLAVKASSGKDA